MFGFRRGLLLEIGREGVPILLCFLALVHQQRIYCHATFFWGTAEHDCEYPILLSHPRIVPHTARQANQGS